MFRWRATAGEGIPPDTPAVPARKAAALGTISDATGTVTSYLVARCGGGQFDSRYDPDFGSNWLRQHGHHPRGGCRQNSYRYLLTTGPLCCCSDV